MPGLGASVELKNSRVVLIGGAGLVGSHLADLLIQEETAKIVVFDNFTRGTRQNLRDALRDPRLKIVEGDIRNFGRVQAAVDNADVVFLLAALWLLQCAEDPRAAIDVNVQGNFNVLEACRQAKVKRVIFSSSASVYGNALVEPMPEDHQLNNRTAYGATKVAMEQMFRAYHEMYGLDYVALRYFNIYGPRQDYKNAYVSVIMKVLDRIDGGQPPVIFGDGSQAYDFIYVKDVARANLAALRSEATDEAFNVATGIKTSIKNLVSMLLELKGSSLTPEYRPAGQVFVTDRVGDPGKALSVLGFAPKTALSDGLRELIEWRAERIQEDIACNRRNT
jgi:UDP-glucose 4-epimerase